MKKIVCLVFALVICVVFAVPTMAAALTKTYRDGETIPPGTYGGFVCDKNANVTIDGRVEFVDRSMTLQENSTLTITENGQLIGKNFYYYPYDPTTKIILKKGGKIEIEFISAKCANSFTSLLDGSGIGYTVSDKTVKATSGSSTGSTLSEGSLAVITAVAGLAVGFLVAMFIFKKKKPALETGAPEDSSDEE